MSKIKTSYEEYLKLKEINHQIFNLIKKIINKEL